VADAGADAEAEIGAGMELVGMKALEREAITGAGKVIIPFSIINFLRRGT
jgi:hypothetical protein